MEGSDEINWCIYEVCFKESDEKNVYLFCFIEDQSISDKYIYKAEIGTDLSHVFKK